MFIRYSYIAPPLHFLIPFAKSRVSALLLTHLVRIAHPIHICLHYWRAKLSDRPAALKKVDKSTQWVTLQVADQVAANAGIRLRVGRLEIEVDPGYNRKTLPDVLRVAGSVC